MVHPLFKYYGVFASAIEQMPSCVPPASLRPVSLAVDASKDPALLFFGQSQDGLLLGNLVVRLVILQKIDNLLLLAIFPLQPCLGHTELGLQIFVAQDINCP